MRTPGAAVLLATSLALVLLVPWSRLAGSFVPDLVLVAVMVVATRRPRSEAVLLAAGTGLLRDAFSVAPFGSHAFVLVLVAYATGRLTSSVLVPSFPVRTALCAAGTLATGLLGSLLAHVLSRSSVAAPGGDLFARVVATAACGLFLWRTSEHRVETRHESLSW